jgi:hypothetical protein
MNLQAVHRTPCSEIPYTRTVSPSVHPCPASGGAADFFLASALRHQQALRPPGVKDARRVQPISATQTNYVYPHLVCSRLALAAFAAGTPHGVLGSVRHDRGNRAFHDALRPLWRIAMQHGSQDGCLTASSWAWAFSTHGADAIEPLTPLSRSDVHPRASLAFARAAAWPCPRLLALVHGSEDVRNAEDHP